VPVAHLDGSTPAGRDPSSDLEAEPDLSLLRREEGLERARARLRVEPGPFVLDLDADATRLPRTRAHDDVPATGEGERIESVLDQAEDRELELLAVDRDRAGAALWPLDRDHVPVSERAEEPLRDEPRVRPLRR